MEKIRYISVMAKTSRFCFLKRYLLNATLKDCGTWLIIKERLIISMKEVLAKDKISLSSLVGTGSKRQIDDLDEEIIKVRW